MGDMHAKAGDIDKRIAEIPRDTPAPREHWLEDTLHNKMANMAKLQMRMKSLRLKARDTVTTLL